MLAAAFAGVLAAVDVVFVTRGVIAPIYLADAVAEGALIAGWAALEVRQRRSPR